MIPEIITLITMALAMSNFGRTAGLIEAGTIRDRINAGIDEDLDHAPLLRERIAVGAAITLAISLAYAWFLHLDDRAAWGTVGLHALRLVATGWAWFTITHRLALNSARKKPWWYCAPGNNYDWRFIREVGNWRYGRKWTQEFHATNLDNQASYRAIIRNAAIAMFAFEGLVAGITLWSLWW